MDGQNPKKAQAWLDFMRLHVPASRIGQSHATDKLPHVAAAREAVERSRIAAERKKD